MQAGRLPKRFPVGTKYVVEGKACGEGQVHIFSRYLVFPDGRCFDLPRNSPRSAPPAPRRAARHSHGVLSLKKH